MRLITGNGLVGSTLKGDVKITSKEFDLRNTESVKSMFKFYNPT